MIPCILSNNSSIGPIELSLIVLGAVQQPSMLSVPVKGFMNLVFRFEIRCTVLYVNHINHLFNKIMILFSVLFDVDYSVGYYTCTLLNPQFLVLLHVSLCDSKSCGHFDLILTLGPLVRNEIQKGRKNTNHKVKYAIV